MPAFAPAEISEEDENDAVSVDALLVVVEVADDVIVSLLVDVVAVAEAGVYDVAVAGCSEEPESS